jgi:outer membrane protein assembly factor BamB
VFAHFGGVTACLDFKGHVRWKHIDLQYASSVVYGAASSPILADDRLIVVQDREHWEEAGKSYVAAYQKSSGQILWRVEPHDARSSYGTPLTLLSTQPPAVVTTTSHALLAYDLRNGNRLWSVPIPVEEIATSMVRDGNRLYISGGSRAAATMALHLREDTKGIAPEALWSASRSAPASASPVYYKNMLFTLSQNGVASCYDAATGDLHWKSRLAPGDYYASLTAADGKLYATNQEGVTTVFEASTRFNILGRNDLGEPTYSSPAIGRGSIFLRTGRALYCIRLPAAHCP